jgi:hypothetical protein
LPLTCHSSRVPFQIFPRSSNGSRVPCYFLYLKKAYRLKLIAYSSKSSRVLLRIAQKSSNGSRVPCDFLYLKKAYRLKPIAYSSKSSRVLFLFILTKDRSAGRRVAGWPEPGSLPLTCHSSRVPFQIFPRSSNGSRVPCYFLYLKKPIAKAYSLQQQKQQGTLLFSLLKKSLSPTA